MNEVAIGILQFDLFGWAIGLVVAILAVAIALIYKHNKWK